MFGSWILPAAATETLAWTLIHFLWQGLACAALGLLLVRGLTGDRPQARHNVWLAIFVLMAIAPVVTWIALSRGISSSQLLAAASSKSSDAIVAEISASAMGSMGTWWLDQAPASVSVVDAPPPNEALSWSVIASEAWPQMVVAVWLLGTLVTSLRLVGAAAWVWCIVARLQPASEATVQRARQLGRRLGLRRIPRIAVSSDVSEPMALQWFRPLVLLPASWVVDVAPEVLEAVLAHELAHIRRHDLWVNLGQRVVETLLFFHPCVWWVSKQIRIERELCCDADAVSATGQPVQYAQALEVVARRRWACASSRLAVGMGGSRMALLNRVKRVLGVESSAAGSDWWTLGMASVGVSAACWLGTTLWTAPVQGDESADALALANEEELRPAPPRREGEGRPEQGERREGDARPERPPPRGERGPREGERGPLEGERREGDRGEGGRDGRERGPGREGPRPPRPPHEITEELAKVIRESAERGQPVPREQVERLLRELQQGHEAMLHGRGPFGAEGRPGPGRGEGGPGPFGPDRAGPFGPGREGPGEHGMRGPGGPPMEVMQDMMRSLHDLREEVGRLRAELNEMRGHRPPGPPRDGDREGPPRGPRDGEGPPPRGPRDGEASPPRGPRDGEGRPRGPRDGEGPPRGPRDEGGPRPESRPDAA